MNKSSNKSKLSKKLKFISVASAITICVASSTGGTEASASVFRNLWTRMTGWFSSGSNTSTTTSGRLNRPTSGAALSGTSSNTKGGSSSVWGRIKSKLSSSGSNNLKTTDLDEPTKTTSSLWARFKGLFTGSSGSNTTSNKNKSGVENLAYDGSGDSDGSGSINSKLFDNGPDTGATNLGFLLDNWQSIMKTSKPSTSGQTSSSSTSGGGDGIQYIKLDFSGKTSSNTVHGSENATIYAKIQPPTSGTTGSTNSSSSSGSGGGRRPIPTPRKNLSGNLQTSSTGSNDGNNGGNTTGVLTSKTQGFSSDSQSSSSNSTGPVIVGEGYGFRNLVNGDQLIIQTVAPPTPVRPKGLGQTNYTPRVGSNTTTSTSLTTTGGSNVLTPRTTTGGGATSSNTGGDGSTKPRLVTFKS